MRETEVRCFARSDAFSSEIHSASCELKENYETQRQNINSFMFFGGGSLASLGSHDDTPLAWGHCHAETGKGLPKLLPQNWKHRIQHRINTTPADVWHCTW
jgi:hypothetical protein